MQYEHAAVLITGGSRGLGLALGRRLAIDGARVVVVARDVAPLRAAVERVRAELGDRGAFHGIEADVGDKSAIHRIAGEAAALVGSIDLLVNNASTLGPTPLGLLLDGECEDFERVLAVNLLGPYRLTKIIAGSMALRGTGLVVNVSSDAAVEAYPAWGMYGASKAALDHLTRTLAAELDETGVRFLAVDPGEMDTQMHADALPQADRASLTPPSVVAARLIELIRRSADVPNGSRHALASLAQGGA